MFRNASQMKVRFCSCANGFRQMTAHYERRRSSLPRGWGALGLRNGLRATRRGVTWRRGQHYRPPRRTFALCGKLAASAKAACSRVCRMGQVGAEIGLDFGGCGAVGVKVGMAEWWSPRQCCRREPLSEQQPASPHRHASRPGSVRALLTTSH